MTKTLRIFGFLSLAWLLACGATLRAADTTDYGTPAGVVIVPDGVSASEVQKVILDSATGRGWAVKEQDSGKVVIVLVQDNWTSKLTLTYTDKEIDIYSKSFKNSKPKLPEGWLKNLKQDMNSKFKTLSMAKAK